jgi:hypothetical protein
MSRIVLLDTIQSVSWRWRAAVVGAASAMLGAVGARVGLPGVDGRVVQDFLPAHPSGLLRLYDLLVGGALSRGAVLALGVMPYLSALGFMAIARSLSPAIRSMGADESGQRKLRRWTRDLSVGLGLVQSYGYATFIESIPGAVANPGAGFIARTVVILTCGTVVAIALGEQIAAPMRDDQSFSDDVVDRATSPVGSDGEAHTAALPGAAPKVFQGGAENDFIVYSQVRPEAESIPRV